MEAGRVHSPVRYFFGLLISLLVVASSAAQERIVHRDLPGMPYLSFAYRRVGLDSATAKNKMEWAFFNRTDSTISFTYRLVSSPGDSVAGRVTLAPREQSFAGWLFRGSTFSSVDCTDVEFKTNR
jgi:hypothetical protein